MRVCSIRLSNGYKRFHHLTIDLGNHPSRIIALIGPNGCGKSSVLDGMLYLHNVHSRLGKTGPRKAAYHSLHGQLNYSHDNIEVNFNEGSYQEVWNKKEAAGKANTIFSFRSPYRYNADVKVKETKAVDEIFLNNYGASTTGALDDKMETNYRRLQAAFAKYRDAHDVKPSEAQSHIVGELNNALANCLDLRIFSLGEIQSDQGTIYFEKSDQSQPFEFNVLSAGEKEVVDILLDLYLRRDDYDDTVFLIDEPELHISTATQRKLLLEINQLVGVGCQIWVATHSVGFLRALQAELLDDCQIIHFEPGADFAKSAHKLEPIAKTHQSWSKIFQTALDDLTGLVCPRRIVYCEGKAETRVGEERGLDARVYNNIFGESFSDTLFVSSGGGGEPQQRSSIAIDILKKALVDLEILVLLDRDFASGKSTDENDRRIYLETNPDNHRVLRRWELENYLYDKEVLKMYSKRRRLQFDEECYERKSWEHSR